MMTIGRWSVMSAWVAALAVVIGVAGGLASGGDGGVMAADKSLIHYQGRIMERHGQTLVIDEKPFQLTPSTRVLTQTKRLASERQLVRKQWVGVVAESTPDGLQIRTIYLLSRQLTGSASLALFAEETE